MGGVGNATEAASAPEGNKQPLVWFEGKALFWWPWPALVALDLWSKSAAFSWMEERYANEAARHLVFASELLRFELVTWENPGTIWGLFGDGTIALMVLRSATCTTTSRARTPIRPVRCATSSTSPANGRRRGGSPRST